MAIRRTGTPNWKLHPGEILREEFLKPMKLSAYALAKAIHVPAPRVNDIVPAQASPPSEPPCLKSTSWYPALKRTHADSDPLHPE